MTLTRRSSSFSPTVTLIRPSWVRRRSAMSSLARILMRERMAPSNRRGGLSRSISRPSIRYRTRMRSSNGSMWMSEARSCTASVMINCTSRTIGALVSSTSSSPPLAVVDRLGEVDRRVGEFLEHRVGALADRLAVVAVDRLQDALPGGQGDVDLAIENEPQLLERVDFHRDR